MAFKIIYANEVYIDLQEAVDFYNSRKKWLSAHFFETVKIQIARIKSNPHGYQIRYDDVRCAPVDIFPYTIHYKIFTEINIIKVIAVFCDYRDPKIWETRTSDE
jgi:hypothetical protein